MVRHAINLRRYSFFNTFVVYMAKMNAREVRNEQKRLVGWIARSEAVYGVWNDLTPHGFMIQRHNGIADTPTRSKFEMTIFKTRGEAKRDLLHNANNCNS